jgi:hypothetical protein
MKAATVFIQQWDGKDWQRRVSDLVPPMTDAVRPLLKRPPRTTSRTSALAPAAEGLPELTQQKPVRAGMVRAAATPEMSSLNRSR